MVKVTSIELHSYYENTLPTGKYKLIIFTTLDSYFRAGIGITPDGPVGFLSKINKC
jgi:hypothetical protein